MPIMSTRDWMLVMKGRVLGGILSNDQKLIDQGRLHSLRIKAHSKTEIVKKPPPLGPVPFLMKFWKQSAKDCNHRLPLVKSKAWNHASKQTMILYGQLYLGRCDTVDVKPTDGEDATRKFTLFEKNLENALQNFFLLQILSANCLRNLQIDFWVKDVETQYLCGSSWEESPISHYF